MLDARLMFMIQGSCLIAKGHLLAMSIAPWDMSNSPSSMHQASSYHTIKLLGVNYETIRLLGY